MKKKDNKHFNFIKVAYFDESSISDFMEIVNEGKKDSTIKETQIKETDKEMSAELEAALASKKNLIVEIFSPLIAKFGIEGAIEYIKNKSIENTSVVKSTLYYEFQKSLNTDKIAQCYIKAFKEISVYPLENSFTFFMLMAPYTSLVKNEIVSDNTVLDISKLEEVIKKGRGYYELLSTIKNNNQEEIIVLRFNIESFRNNYTLSDLIKMKLTYYAIYVGEIELDNLNVNNEFLFGVQDKHHEDIADKVLKDKKIISSKSSAQEDKKIKVYDVLIGGIEVVRSS